MKERNRKSQAYYIIEPIDNRSNRSVVELLHRRSQYLTERPIHPQHHRHRKQYHQQHTVPLLTLAYHLERSEEQADQ